MKKKKTTTTTIKIDKTGIGVDDLCSYSLLVYLVIGKSQELVLGGLIDLKFETTFTSCNSKSMWRRRIGCNADNIQNRFDQLLISGGVTFTLSSYHSSTKNIFLLTHWRDPCQ